LTGQTLFWIVFVFAIGASVGSFLNVVVYRLPRELSIVRPGSHCTQCKHPIAWYDNLPIVAWFILGGKCRHCHARFSIRYALVELFTALLFVFFFCWYFIGPGRADLPALNQGGWLIYASHVFLAGALLACSLIDAEHWIIPLEVSYTVAAIGLIAATAAPYVLPLPDQPYRALMPHATPLTAALALGAGLGLALSLALLRLKVLTRSFAEYDEALVAAEKAGQEEPDIPLHIRREMVRELAFLAPVALVAALALFLLTHNGPLANHWNQLLATQKWLTGLLGSVFGFMIGAAVVWVTRILGSLAFGREAMGLGDVHLMAGVGAILGWTSPLIAFFVAPFLGLGWALARLILHRAREIPYGPFLSAATVLVMLFHDRIVDYFAQVWAPPAWP